MFVFKNDSSFVETLNYLNSLSPESYSDWLSSYNITTFRSVFDNTMQKEWEISDYYEEQFNSGKEIPTEQVHSQEYYSAINAGILRVVEDKEGEYFDYNLFETPVAPLINQDGLVQIGGKIIEYGLGTKKIIEDGDFKKVATLENYKKGNIENKINVIYYSPEKSPENARPFGHHEWLYSTKEGNQWIENYNNKHRFRMAIHGSSYIDGEPPVQQLIYVTNFLKIEGQKKNVWGNWGYRVGYPSDGSVSWDATYFRGSSYKSAFELPHQGQIAPAHPSPFSWQFPNSQQNYHINNATLYLAPHAHSYYLMNSGAGVVSDGVSLSNVSGSVNIGGNYLVMDVTVTEN